MSDLVVAILDTMWDWQSRTSAAGYEQAPNYYQINPRNFSGRRLYQWVGNRRLLVTNACPQLVTSASGRGTPDPQWLHDNLRSLQPYSLLLVCGQVAQDTFWASRINYSHSRIVFTPHPAARMWTKAALELAGKLIRHGSADHEIYYEAGRFRVMPLIPF